MHAGKRLSRIALAVLLLLASVAVDVHAATGATSECLVAFAGVPADAANGGTWTCEDCDPTCDADGVATANGSCTFDLGVCANGSDPSCTGTALKRVKVAGSCHGGTALGFSPTGATESCGPRSGIVVKLKGKGRKTNRCKIMARTSSAAKPKRTDRDVLTLVCMPRPAGEPCPTTTTTTTTPATTTTTSPCGVNATVCTPAAGTMCEPLVADAQGIPGTYQMVTVAGPTLCQTNAPTNRFGPCSSEEDCGGQAGTTAFCSATPFATADGIELPFPVGIKTVFTIAQDDPAPTCSHGACIACGNGAAACAVLPGCGSTPGTPAAGCVRNQCCDQPGFTVPAFQVPLLGGLCSRLDQYGCGAGVVNTSNPPSGDNEVTKIGDTSDPGPDCEYGTPDDPAKKSCDTSASGAGHDLRGRIARCVGNGVCDAAGIHYRLAVPMISTTWQDSSGCSTDATFDVGELIVTQIVLTGEFTTAGAASGFADLNGDGCAQAGAGFASGNKIGPIAVGSPPAAPQPYDSSTCGSGVCSTAVSAGPVFTGSSPLFDMGFVAMLTNGAITRQPTAACTCTPEPGCPE